MSNLLILKAYAFKQLMAYFMPKSYGNTLIVHLDLPFCVFFFFRVIISIWWCLFVCTQSYDFK